MRGSIRASGWGEVYVMQNTNANSLWSRLCRRKSALLCIIVIAIYAACAVWGEITYRSAQLRDTTPAYNEIHENKRYLPPFRELENPLGTDNLGRNVALRLVQGTRIAFHVGVVTSLIAIPLGVILGLAGGWFGGVIDSIVVWLCATVASMPGLLFILAISLVAGKGLMGIYLGIGLTTWVGVCRTIRAEVIKHRCRAYVQAARVLGYSNLRIMFRHILPNVMHLVLIQFSIRFPSAVATEVLVSFLGIGVQGEPSWGIMINNARLRLWQGVWWEMTFVTLAIFILVLAFNHLADVLRDLLDPTLRNAN